jgi:LysM repeat protein
MSIDEYINRYSTIAKGEMRRTGIPASIKLAQGILESSFGNSPLATEANNHFGIKCHTGYQGKGYYMTDDAVNECFRMYEKPEESYYDHSEFLRTRPRYADLFKLDPKDYKGWARGLKEAGYATNPQYANLLIRMIEDRKLHDFDTADPELSKSLKTEEDVIKTFENKLVLFNGLKTVIAQPKQTFVDIGEKFGVSYKNMKKFNEYEDDDSNYYLIPGSKVYLQTKKTKGISFNHKVQENETMHMIAQKEGIQLKKLYEYNLMNEGEEPAIGETLLLQKKGKNRPKLKSQKDTESLYDKVKRLTLKNAPVKEEIEVVKEDTVVIDKPVIVETTIQPETKPIVVKDEKLDIVAPTQQVPIFHIVEPKQTLYSISMMYNVKTTMLMDWNNLKTVSLEPNQKLIVGYETDKIKTAADLKVKTTERTPIVHVVKPRETIYSISEWYNVKPDDIKRWNNLPDFKLKDDMEIVVGYINPQQPKPAPPEVKAEVKTEVKKEEVKPVVKAPESNIDSKKFPQYHIVAQGETLYGLCTKYGIAVSQMMKMNNMSSIDLSVGQKLIIGYEELAATETPKQPIKETPKPVETKPTPVVAKKEEVVVAPKKETATNNKFHTVEKGETLYAISRKYNVPVEELIVLNNLSSTAINTGQRIIVSGETTATKTNEPSIEPKKVNVEKLPQAKPVQMDDAGNPFIVDGIKYHVVQPGETLYRLSVNYKVPVEKLQEWNNLADYTLQVNQRYIVGK